jgi:hypothetical protein
VIIERPIQDSYSSTFTFTYTPDDGEHAAAVILSIAHVTGGTTDVQFIGEGGVARVLDRMQQFITEVRS